MDKKKKKKKKNSENLRLVVLDGQTFKERFSFSLSVKNIYILLSSIIVILFILIFLLISFTPLKHLVPGYGNIENNSYVIKLNQYINDLETKIETQDLYNNALRKILVENDMSDIVVENNNHIIKSNTIKTSHSTSSKNIYNFSSPLNGIINKKIDIKIGHYGIDIGSSKNAPIKSVMKGTVLFSDWSTETGNTIIIQHADGIISVYKHNSKLFKETGDLVEKDEVIGIIGDTGTLSNGPHLHFELWIDGIPQDPLKYIDID